MEENRKSSKSSETLIVWLVNCNKNSSNQLLHVRRYHFIFHGNMGSIWSLFLKKLENQVPYWQSICIYSLAKVFTYLFPRITNFLSFKAWNSYLFKYRRFNERIHWVCYLLGCIKIYRSLSLSWFSCQIVLEKISTPSLIPVFSISFVLCKIFNLIRNIFN